MLTNRIMGSVYSPLDNNIERIIFKSAKNYLLVDIQNNEYYDLLNGKGSIVLGHNNDLINNALYNFLTNNENIISGPSVYTSQLANIILGDVMLDNSSILFFTTGTSACRAAITMARRATKKHLVLNAGYHGWDPMWEHNINILEPNKSGVINFYYIYELLEQAIHKYKNEIACMIFSPDYIFYSPETLIRIMKLCKNNNIYVCCDDVKQGYRHISGSSLKLITNMQADLYIFAKGLSNGHKLSCIVGREAIMKNNRGIEYTSYFENTAIISSIITLNHMKAKNGYEKITKLVKKLVSELNYLIEKYQAPMVIKYHGVYFQFIFDSETNEKIFYHLALENKIILFYKDNQTLNFSYDGKAVNHICEAFENILINLCKQRKIKTVSENRLLLASWSVTDGISDAFNNKSRMLFLNKMMKLINMF